MSRFAGAPLFIQRIFHGGSDANTVNTPTHEYKIELRLGDVDLIFANTAGTPGGRKERLQVLGLLPYPLDHPECGPCFDWIWGHYVKPLLAAPSGAALTDAETDRRIQEELGRFLVEGGELPKRKEFAKLRVPGDWRVLHRDFDPGYLKEPHFTLAKGNRGDVEARIWAANPALGKIPIVAKVLRRHRGEDDSGWRAMSNALVHFQLRKPDKLPGYQARPGPAVELAGATTWNDQVSCPALRRRLGASHENISGGADLKNVRKPRHGDPGPGGYLDRHVYKRRDPDFPADDRNDPQAGNAWWALGGKRGLSQTARCACDPRTHDGVTHPNVFVLTDVGSFYTVYKRPTDVPDGERADNAYAVRALTNDYGEAGVIFAPSAVGGDRYRLRAYTRPTAKARARVSTGTLVRWRTVRISRNVRVTPPTSGAGLSSLLKSEFVNLSGGCQHAEKHGARSCARCLLREGAVPALQFQDYLRTELSKAWCELLVDRNPDREFSTVVDKQALARVVDRFMKSQEKLRQLSGTMQFGQEFAVSDGATRTFTGTLKARAILPRTVKVKIGDYQIAVDNGAGGFTEVGDSAVFALGGFDVTGSVNYNTGAVQLTFGATLPAGRAITIACRTRCAIDFRKLVYFSARSPFLLNLHSLEAYNSRIDRTKFPPLTVPEEVKNAAIGVGDGVAHTLTKTLEPNLETVTLKLDGADLPADDFLALVQKSSGQVEVRALGPARDEFAVNASTGRRQRFQLASAPEPKGPTLFEIQAQITGPGTTTATLEPLGVQRAFENTYSTTANTPLALGSSATYDPATRTIDLTLGADPTHVTKLVVTYKTRKPLAAGKTITADYTAQRVYDQAHPRTSGGPVKPDATLLGHVNRIINWYLLAPLIRAIEDNRGYMPGLILLRAPLRDTWSGVWSSKGFHEGKGVCNGLLVFYGNRWRTDGYDAGLEAGDGSQAEAERYNALLLHELSHCFYHNHFASGANVAGPRADQHDLFDACLMGYGKHNDDLCGQCVAGYMGLKSADRRMMTWNGAIYTKGVELSTEADEKTDASKKRHVEPPDVAAPRFAGDSDDVYAMLTRCPVGNNVYQRAMRAAGWPGTAGSFPQPLGDGGVLDIVGSAEGRGSHDYWAPSVGYTLTDKIKLADDEVPVDGAELHTTVAGEKTQKITGADIGVQVLIMELSNCSRRYEFFDLDNRTKRGHVGPLEYMTQTERIEYDNGVRNVIRAYNQCHAQWKARLCTKQKAAACADFQEYFDRVLPGEHKAKYLGYWHTTSCVRRSFFWRHCPRVRAFNLKRLDALGELLDRDFANGKTTDGIPHDAFKLWADDRGVWQLLNVLFAIDADFDLDTAKTVTNWARGILATQPDTASTIQRVQAVATAARSAHPHLTIPAVT